MRLYFFGKIKIADNSIHFKYSLSYEKRNIYIYIYDKIVNNNIELINFLNQQKNIENYNVNMINYKYYKYFSISDYKLIYQTVYNTNFDLTNYIEIVPPYKLLLPDLNSNYGFHRYGWKEVIHNLLNCNYTENDNFNHLYPDIEWIYIALKYNLSTYNEVVEYIKINNNIYYESINFIYFDDWLEKTFFWGVTKNKDLILNGKKPFISFLHDPDLNNIHSDHRIICMKKNEQNKLYNYDFKNINILITLSKEHMNFLINNNLYKNSLIKYIHHPILHSLDIKRTNSITKSYNIYMIGWWLRKIDIFINLNTDIKKILYN